jgi:brefeldin A-resistance guanine nucleotide exchange factor 1
MGSLGMSMGLRSGLSGGKDGNYRNQVSGGCGRLIHREIIANVERIHQESPLMHGFTSLRSYLTTVRGKLPVLLCCITSCGHARSLTSPLVFWFTDIYELDASMLLNPFLDVIRSGNTTGPIAGAALSSVEKFLQYGIIGEALGAA